MNMGECRTSVDIDDVSFYYQYKAGYFQKGSLIKIRSNITNPLIVVYSSFTGLLPT